MIKRSRIKNVFLIVVACSLIACEGNGQNNSPQNQEKNMSDKIEKSEEEWQKVLDPLQYEVLREKGTERPYSGKYYLHTEKGMYICAGCGAELFKSDTKFDAGCGWPSFSDVVDSSKVVYTRDTSHGMIRTEITCAKCGGHLGHVFDDGPAPTGLRYCINSVSIDFKKE
jgi:peptide-methionine (R)-S-oxide reductase